MNYQETKRPIIIVVERGGTDALRIYRNLLMFLPPSFGWTLSWASHVVEPSDHVRDAALLFTYPDTPFLEQSRRRQDPRAPLVLEQEREPQQLGA